MANTAHLGHPSSEFKTGLAREDIVAHMTASTGRRILLSLYECLRMCPFKITLVFLRMTLLTFLVIEKKRRYSPQQLWIRMLDPLFFNVCMAL
jgi:hypothetical protein